DGATFLVRDDRQVPCFFIRTSDAARAWQLCGCEARPTAMTTFDGSVASSIEVSVPADVPAIRERLHAQGVDTFEADVRFPVRFLIEHGIKGSCEIAGEAQPGTGSAWVFHNPELRPAVAQIEPVVLSFDIETDPQAQRLLAISLYGQAVDEVLIVDDRDRPMPERASRCRDERQALSRFCQRIRELDPDVLTGWNTIDFDLTVLQRIAARLHLPLELGRDTGELRLRRAEGYFGSGQASVPGRLVLDGIDLLRGAFVRMEDYSLDAVSREVLGEGKAMRGPAHERLTEILDNYREDLPAFSLYARTDARLAWQIVHKLDLIRLSFARSQLTGMMPDRVAASIASFDFVYLTELHKRQVVAPTVRSSDARVHAAQSGGHVLEAVSGLHRNVWLFDFKSLYPNIIRTFNIDPLTYIPGSAPQSEAAASVAGTGSRDGAIVTPGGAFRREPAILPALLDELFPRREAARAAQDAVAANAIKILMNSFYGVLGTPACRFYNPALANSITLTGKELLLWSKRWFEQEGFRVLYGDTDSLFVGSGSTQSAPASGPELAAALNRALASYIRSRWDVHSHLELEFEKTWLRLFLPPVRHGNRGASKRYAGLVEHGTAQQVEFVGMEVVRSDWTALAREVQRELYQRLFTEQPLEHYLTEVVRQLRAGELDDQLVYRKNLRKGTEAYTATTPPHVQAARKSARPAGREVRYVMTTAGPEPIDNIRHPLDREHYVAKQLRPVAEPVLATLGLSFEALSGDARQAELPF
ncbi:MAG: DNA polymerase II, partial [Sinobacteraceae bacterium]|nr:DNA polymerase II [Nevskiaceae bacterium]